LRKCQWDFYFEFYKWVGEGIDPPDAKNSYDEGRRRIYYCYYFYRGGRGGFGALSHFQ